MQSRSTDIADCRRQPKARRIGRGSLLASLVPLKHVFGSKTHREVVRNRYGTIRVSEQVRWVVGGVSFDVRRKALRIVICAIAVMITRRSMKLASGMDE